MISTEIKEIKEVPEERIYYIYEYWRLDNNTCFYVGKGKADRCYHINNRSKHFKNILNKVDVAVTIVAEGLTEAEALATESFIINEYVMDEGYGIDIIDIKKNSTGCNLVNATWGGEGVSGLKHSEDVKRRSGDYMRGRTGNLHHLYGYKHKEETREKMSNKKKIKVLMLDKNTGEALKIFNSLLDAEGWLGKINANTHISKCCKGMIKSAYGYR